MIRVIGPNWESTRALQLMLEDAPESGEFRWATGHRNKLEQLKLMAAGGVEVVPTTEDIEEAIKWARTEGSRVFGRRYHHSQGRDILVWQNDGRTDGINRRWRKRDFWSKWVPSQEEWRIHIFNDKSIARSKKVASHEPEDSSSPLASMVRNYENGWRFHHRHEPPRGIRKFAKAMVEACGYLYGACDILVKEDGHFVALEVNTAPAMDTSTLRKYVQAIRGKYAN